MRCRRVCSNRLQDAWTHSPPIRNDVTEKLWRDPIIYSRSDVLPSPILSASSHNPPQACPCWKVEKHHGSRSHESDVQAPSVVAVYYPLRLSGHRLLRAKEGGRIQGRPIRIIVESIQVNDGDSEEFAQPACQYGFSRATTTKNNDSCNRGRVLPPIRGMCAPLLLGGVRDQQHLGRLRGIGLASGRRAGGHRCYLAARMGARVAGRSGTPARRGQPAATGCLSDRPALSAGAHQRPTPAPDSCAPPAGASPGRRRWRNGAAHRTRGDQVLCMSTTGRLTMPPSRIRQQRTPRGTGGGDPRLGRNSVDGCPYASTEVASAYGFLEEAV